MSTATSPRNNNNNNGANVNNVRYAEAVTRRGQPVNAAVKFPSGTTDLYAVFDYSGFAGGGDLTYVWYADGFEIERDSFVWDGGESGTSWVSVYNDNGLDDGLLELELIYAGASVYRGGVTIGAGDGSGPNPGNPVISDIRFAPSDENGDPGTFGDTFSGLNEVVGEFDYSGMTNGADWGYAWFYEGQNVADNSLVWDGGESGTYDLYLSHPDGLPEGGFRLEIYVDGQTVQAGEFTIQGSGNNGSINDVSVIGTVVDRNNSRTMISGALIVFLNPGTSIRDWVNADFDDSMVYATGTSNRSGSFQLSARVTPGEYYSIVVVHDDYEPITVDDFQIPPDATDPYELQVTMDHS